MTSRPLQTRMRRRLDAAVAAATLAVISMVAMPAHAEVTGGGAAAQATCWGEWANPISDYCWNCIFPISIGVISLDMGQEDIENPASPVCWCPIPVPPYVRMGVSVGFWEPHRIIESTRTPFCFPSLGGYTMNSGSASSKPSGATKDVSISKVSRDSFYQLHLYANPVMYYLQSVIDDVCLESGSFDIAYLSEYDSAWHDDAETAILEPEAVLFATIPAQLACSADCVAANLGFGLEALFWCDGCNGPVYPMDGNVPVHIGGIQASSLLNHRILAKMHRLGISWQWHGAGAVCNGQMQPLMDKRGYKTQMLYPVPMTAGTDGTSWGRCCQPLGRTTQVWGIGREFPIKGEDFAYLVFRKRNCCMD